MKQANETAVNKNLSIKRFLHAKETPVFLVIILMCVVLSILTPNFLTKSNILTTLVGLSADGIVAIAMTVILAMGGIDLSVGSVMGLSSMVAAKIAVGYGNIWLGALAGLLVGILVGIINGLFIAKLKLTPFIMTLAMMSIAKGSSMLLSSGKSVAISKDKAAFMFLGQGYIFGVIPVPLIITVALYVLAWWYLDKTYLGRRVYLSGGNEEAARLSGINTKWTITGTYVFSGVFAAIAGVLMAARLGSGQPSVGSGFEMDVITATVLGGISVNGGKGKVVNVFVGACIMGVLANGMTMLNINQYLQWIINGLVLLFAVTMSNLRKSSS